MLNVCSGRQELQSASPKAVPTARMTSALRALSLATREPQMPVVPSDSGWVSGKTPLPTRVVATGAPSRSASAWSSAKAPESATPLPAKMTGLAAEDRRRAASATPCASPMERGKLGRRERVTGTAEIFCEKTSMGMSSSTAPGRPVWAMFRARCMISGRNLASSTRQTRLQIGRKMSPWEASACRRMLW